MSPAEVVSFLEAHIGQGWKFTAERLRGYTAFDLLERMVARCALARHIEPLSLFPQRKRALKGFLILTHGAARALLRHGPRVESRVFRRDLPSACVVKLQRDNRHELRLRREPVIRNDADRQRLVETLAEVCAKTGWLHVSLSCKLQMYASGNDTSRLHQRHRFFGRLFCGLYKLLSVHGSGRRYLMHQRQVALAN